MSIPHPLTLGIDTSNDHCSVALVSPIAIVSRTSLPMRKGHAEALAPMVDDMLRAHHITAKDLSCICVCTGPGSFTGQRVGISFAKGLALPHGTKLVGLSSLEYWALTLDPERRNIITAIANVRRGDVLWQSFYQGHPLAQAKLQRVDDLAINIAKSPASFGTLTGSGAGLINPNIIWREGGVCPAILAWAGLDLDPLTHAPMPLYHRPPDAKLPGGISPPKR